MSKVLTFDSLGKKYVREDGSNVSVKSVELKEQELIYTVCVKEPFSTCNYFYTEDGRPTSDNGLCPCIVGEQGKVFVKKKIYCAFIQHDNDTVLFTYANSRDEILQGFGWRNQQIKVVSDVWEHEYIVGKEDKSNG